MKLETALEKETGRTITELMSAASMSRGGILQALRRNKAKIKIVGSKREHDRGPESKLYALKKGKTFSTNKRSRKAGTDNAALANGIATAVQGAQAQAAAVVAESTEPKVLAEPVPTEAVSSSPVAAEPTAATAAAADPGATVLE